MSSIEIADRIEEELKRKNIKKSAFYEKCGVSRASFSQWKHGLHYPTKETLDKINEFLGLAFSITEGGAQKEMPPVHEGGGLDEDDIEILAIFHSIKSDAQKAFAKEKLKQIADM